MTGSQAQALGRTVLEGGGYRVLTADDGVTGVEAFAAHRGGPCPGFRSRHPRAA